MSPLTVRPKIYHQEQYNNDDFSPKDSLPSGGIHTIFTPKSTPANKIGDRKITPQLEGCALLSINTVREVASSIINHPVTKIAGAIAITLLLGWGTKKVLDSVPIPPIDPDPRGNWFGPNGYFPDQDDWYDNWDERKI
jgi:hypothetical protein